MNLGLEEVVLAISLTMQGDVSIPPQDMVCMARNIYHEARGESRIGQLAVGYVTLNRVGKDGFGETVCEVVYQDSQFSWTDDQPDAIFDDWDAYTDAMQVAATVFRKTEPDPSLGATYYYNPDKASPSWGRQFTQLAIIGDHRFMEK